MRRPTQIFNLAFISFLLLISSIMKSQNCANLDFSSGNFSNWVGKVGNCCPINLTSNGIVTGRHTIISTQATDPRTCGGLQMIPPGYTHSAKLGNQSTGAESEALSYSMSVDSNNALFLFSYAPVLQDPDNHTTIQQPRFEILIRDANGATILPCSYYIVYGNNATGFNTCGSIVWKNWTTNGVDLRNYIGQTINIELESASDSAPEVLKK